MAVILPWPADTETLTVERPSGRNDFGDPLPATEHAVDGCVWAPGGSTEDTDRAQTVTRSATVYAPVDSDVLATDRVRRADGTRWQVDGEPQRYDPPFFAAGGVAVIILERIT